MSSSEPPDKPFFCRICAKAFAHSEHLAAHIARRHGALPPTSCNRCGKDCADDDRLQSHRRRRHDEMPPPDQVKTTTPTHDTISMDVDRDVAFPCDDCAKSFDDAQRLARHRQRRHVAPPTPDPIVEKQSAVEQSKMAIHSCSDCAKSFGDEERLARHRARRHVDDRSIPIDAADDAIRMASDSHSCDCCERVFASAERLGRHRKRKHDAIHSEVADNEKPTALAGEEKIEDDVSRCNLCEREFCDAARLERHRRRRHEPPATDADMADANLEETRDEPIPNVRPIEDSTAQDDMAAQSVKKGGVILFCVPDAAAPFTDSLHDETRNRVLRKPKVHACPTCAKRFSSRLTRELHHRHRHSGLHIYKCAICGYRCILRRHTVRHEVAHRGHRPFQCIVCDAAFAQKGNLTVHQRVHTGERPFACDLCDKSFSTSSYRTQHRRIHTGEMPFACEHCGSRFTHSSSFLRHKKSSSVCLRADARPKRNQLSTTAPGPPY